MDVLVIGNTTADTVLTTEHGLKPGEKVQASALVEYPGGQAANTAWTLAALGLEVRFVGAFGDDEPGRSSATSLRDVGVSLEGSATVRGCRSQVGVVVVDAATGERSIIMHRDPRLRLEGSLDDEWIRGARLVYLDGHEPEASLAAARRAAAFGVPVVADAELSAPTRPEFFRYVSCLIAPASVIKTLARAQEVEEALISLTSGKGPAAVVATEGARGSIGLQAGKSPVQVPASDCFPIDTTGAGDAFHAGYIAATLMGSEFEGALAVASELAAAACEVAGPRISRARVAPFRDRLAFPAGDTGGEVARDERKLP